MDKLMYILSGGFAKGYRSYIIGVVLIIQALAGWATGDFGLIELLQKLPEILAGMGIMAAAAHDK